MADLTADTAAVTEEHDEEQAALCVWNSYAEALARACVVRDEWLASRLRSTMLTDSTLRNLG